MRVLIVTEAASAGVGRHVCDLVPGLIEREIDVHLAYSPTRMDEIFRQTFVGKTEIPQIEVAMSRAPGLADFRAFHELRSYMRHNGPFDVVHGHSSKGGAMARMLSAVGSAKSIVTPHASIVMDPTLGRYKRMFFTACEQVLGWMTDSVIALTEAEKSAFHQATRVRQERIEVIPNAIKPPCFESRADARKRLGLPPDSDSLVVGFVGRFSPQKNPVFAFNAFRSLCDRVGSELNLMLAMIGDGELHEPLAREITAAGLAENVVLPGQLPAQEHLQAFDILIMTSRYEGMPYVLIESGWAGLPVVCTKVSGASDLIAQEKSGLIVPQGDLEAFVDSLERLVRDSALRVSMGTAARCIAEKYSINDMIDRTLSLYERIGLENE